MTGALGVMATVPVAAKQVTDAVEPYQDASPWIGREMTAIAPSQQMATVSAMRPAAITTAPAAWLSS